MIRHWIYSGLAGGLVLSGLAGCRETRRDEGGRTARQTWPAMGAFASVTVPRQEREHLADYAAAARARVQELEERLSLFKPDSELSRLNQAAGAGPVPLSTETLTALGLALRYAHKSDGAFDPTADPLLRLWGLRGNTPTATVPNERDLETTLERVGYAGVRLDPTRGTASLERAGMRIDLGGIAKGYAADAVHERLRTMGAENFMVNLGGDMRMRGGPAAGTPWRLGVRDPFDRARFLGILELDGDWGVATSGNYERFVELEGQRYAHILDPRSGRPVRGMASVTVVAPTAAQADALSTALFVLGLEDGVALLKKMDRCEALFVLDGDPPDLRVTPGLQSQFAVDPAWKQRVRATME